MKASKKYDANKVFLTMTLSPASLMLKSGSSFAGADFHQQDKLAFDHRHGKYVANDGGDYLGRQYFLAKNLFNQTSLLCYLYLL